ncbi:hypothetical protein [Bacillus phage vB_BanS-Thrax1]|nr:hypothetical protein [Bacillus phage vB_BanS-Thrax1]
MSFLNKLKKMFIEEKEEEKEKEKEIVFTRRQETPWVDIDVLREKLKKEKEQREKEEQTISVQLNGYYEYSIDEYVLGKFFYIYVNVHGTINCEIDGLKISTPVHYKINIASGATKNNAYESLLRDGDDFMDELKSEIVDELKEILRDNNIQGIKDKIENSGKIRLDIVLDIDKDNLEK